MIEPLKLAIVTDIHHGADKLTKRGSAGLGLLEEFLAFAANWGADMIVDLGDRISDVDAPTDQALMRDVADRFGAVNTPRAHLNGNHDVAYLGEDANFLTFREPAFGRSVELKGIRLLFWQADTRIPYPETFSLRDADLAWLAAELAKSALPTIIFTHVPLGGGAMTGNYWFQNNPQFAAYPNSDQARAIIEQEGHVILCVAGHVHWNALHRTNAIPHIAVQSLTESFTTGGAPAGAWATIEISDRIHWRTYGRDPIEVIAACRKPGECWVPPLAAR